MGRVLEAGPFTLTIETVDGKEKITLHVPLRERDDGTRTPSAELSAAVAALKVGSTVRVQWREGEDKLWIEKAPEVEKEQ